MPDLVIVGSDGTRHRFPDGMDPQQAIQVVKSAEMKASIPQGDLVSARARLNEQEGAPKEGVLKGMTSIGEGMAHPQSVGDFASLLLPSDLGFGGGAKFLGEGASRVYQAAKAAGAETKGVRGVATLPMRTFSKFRDALPSSNTAAVEKFMGPESQAITKPQTLINGADVIDRNMTRVKPPVVPKPPMAKTPTLEEALQQAVEESLSAKEPAMRSTAAPAAETTGAGGYKQSWPKSKKQNLGGYDSGNPPPRADAVEAAAEPVASAPASQAAPVSDTRMDELVGKLGGTQGDVTVTPDKLKLSVPEVADSLRRYYGSRDGGRMLFPNDPAGGAEALKRLAPGPSRIPLTAQARINNVPQPQSLEDALRDIILKRSNP